MPRRIVVGASIAFCSALVVLYFFLPRFTFSAANYKFPVGTILALDFDYITTSLQGEKEIRNVVNRAHVSLLNELKLVPGVTGNALFIDSAKHFVLDCPLPQRDSPRTLSLWAKLNDGQARDREIAKWGTAATGQKFGICGGAQDGADGGWFFYGHIEDLITPKGVDYDWHHHCVTFDRSLLTYYLDGNVIGERKLNLFTRGSRLEIGSTNPENSFIGSVDNVLVASRCLSCSEVKSVYEGSKTLSPGSD